MLDPWAAELAADHHQDRSGCLRSGWRRLDALPPRVHNQQMQVQCPKCKVIVAIGKTKWFFDGGECRELRGTEAGEAKAYEKCPVLIEAVGDAEKNASFP